MNAPRLRIWDEDTSGRVHEATLRVLSSTGVEMHHERARELLAGLGARIDGVRVFIDAALVDAALESVARDALLAGREGASSLELRDGPTYYGTGPDCLYVRDAVHGERRRATLADVTEAARVSELSPNIDFVMSMALPADAPSGADDLCQFAAMLLGTLKPVVMSTPREGDRVRAMHHMAAAAGDATSFACLTMASPPLKHDREALDKLMVCAELGVPLILAPAPGAGTTAPASVASTVVVGNAEVLSGLVLHQAVKRGAPFVYGSGVSVTNMRTALDVYCAPEVFSGNHAACELARFYQLPSWHYAGCSDAKAIDGQLAAESAITTLLGALSRATLLHDVGYLESGLQSSLDSIVLGDELVGYARAFMDGVRVDDETLALEEIEAVGPGGNHLARPYTRRHFREFWRPGLLDQSVHDRWQAGGALTLADRVRARVEELRGSCAGYEPPAGLVNELAGLAGVTPDTLYDGQLAARD
jgi:trimethylamine--corrinoid protein Co-methyltransferase